MTIPTLEDYLNGKPLAYAEIDYNRMPNAYKSIEKELPHHNYIHIVGTNGKGTTGRFLAEMLYRKGFSVGHYTSPHISKLNERFWFNGSDINDEVLKESHSFLQNSLSENYLKTLSYFEYTTLLVPIVFKECDYVVLEAGLGGEFDATNVYEKILSIFTPIGFDHQSFLGNTLKEIASTKFRSLGERAIISKQVFPEVYDYLNEIAKERNSKIYKIEFSSDNYLEENFQSAKMALDVLRIENDFKFGDIPQLKGRIEKIAPNITIDVGHNPLAVDRIIETLNDKKPILIYNSLSDKPYQEILKKFKNNIERVEIIKISDERALKLEDLEDSLKNLDIEFRYFKEIKDSKEYLVFGSFKVVEEFLKIYDSFSKS